jgi:hypothetical protein
MTWVHRLAALAGLAALWTHLAVSESQAHDEFVAQMAGAQPVGTGEFALMIVLPSLLSWGLLLAVAWAIEPWVRWWLSRRRAEIEAIGRPLTRAERKHLVENAAFYTRLVAQAQFYHGVVVDAGPLGAPHERQAEEEGRQAG